MVPIICAIQESNIFGAHPGLCNSGRTLQTPVSGNILLVLVSWLIFLCFFLIWCLDKLGLNREQAGALLTSKNESCEGHLDLSYGYRVVHLWPFGICSGLHDPSCRILPPVSVEFLSPHFLLLIILFIVSHL